MKAFRVAFPIILSVISPIAQADDAALKACVEIYKNATRDYSQEQQESVELARSFSSFCQKDGSVSSSASGIGLDAIVNSIPFKFSVTSNSSQQKLTEFCKIGSTQFDTWNKKSVATSTVVTGALSNFNGCIQLANSGLQLSVSINQPDILVVSGFANATYNGDISSVAYDIKLMSCSSADFNAQHKVQVLNGPVRLRTSLPFAITCTKKQQVSLDKKTTYYPRTTLTIAAGAQSPLAIAFPSDSLNGYELASEARLAVDRAATSLNEGDARAAAQKQLADALQNRLNGVSARIVTHEFGSGTLWGCGPYGGDWGRALNEEAQRTCGASRYVTGSANVRPGGTCGYGSNGFTCIDVPQ